MQLHHFDTFPDHLVVAMCVVRFAEPIAAHAVRAVTEQLGAAHVLDDVIAEVDGGTCYLAGAWIPRTGEAHAAGIAQVRALADAGADAAWFFAVATTIDAIAAEAQDGDGDGDGHDHDHDHDHEDDDDDDDEHWRHGPPPLATSAPFQCDNYPDILDEFDGDDFGFAVKLAAPGRPGAIAVVRALHRVWMAAYVDRRVDQRPFRNASVAFDPRHGAAILWVDEFGPPATIAQMVHHLLWIVGALHEVVPIVHGRFCSASMVQKYGEMMGHEGPPFVLAGNPLRAQLAEGDAVATAWVDGQTSWSAAELAAMYVEAGTDLDPDDAEQSVVAVARFDRAAALAPSNAEAGPYAQVALVRGGRVDAALDRAKAGDAGLRAHTLALVAEHAAGHLRAALGLVDRATLEAVPDEQLADLLVAIGNGVPDEMPRVLRAIPERADLVAHVFNATFRCEDAAVRLMMLEYILDMPVPDEGAHRDAFTYAHNNACVLAHQIGEFGRAAMLADRAQIYAEENPYIFHGAACAYVAVGRMEDAMAQVERAVARDYDHLDKLELDADLGELRTWPRFIALFAGWRERLTHSEPIREISTDEFTAVVLDADVPVLVDFTATWCGPCQRQAPILERLAQGSAGRFRVVKVDIDDEPELAERYDATSVPTLVVFHGGRECGRRVGLSQRAQLDALLQQARSELN